MVDIPYIVVVLGVDPSVDGLIRLLLVLFSFDCFAYVIGNTLLHYQSFRLISFRHLLS